ncbi:MAG: hypothetical protein M1282_14040, partial [Chloroflexi bacterium]|nr:hypothetical protein [Chloroflexota bacterium]
KVEIEGKACSLHIIKKTSAGDRQITVQSNGDLYGWAPVIGKSMNAWDTPLNEGDYVLIYKTSVASHGDFVIAANRDSSGEMAPIVKRFDAENYVLLSKSNDKSRAYPPIPMDEDHQIVGVVIAVAKPTQ